MTCNSLKTCATVLSLATIIGGCATSQQPRTAPAEGYNTPATSSRPAAPPSQYARQASRYYYSDGESMLLDAVFLRPVSLVGAAVGAAVWIVSLPFSVPSESAGAAFEALVETPVNYTFGRPLGDISACRDTDPGCRYPQSW
jgi:hypothetical protein